MKGDFNMVKRMALVLALLGAWATVLPVAAEDKDDAGKNDLKKLSRD